MFSFKSFIVVGGGALFIWGRCLSLLGFHSCNLVPAINTDKLATAPPPSFLLRNSWFLKLRNLSLIMMFLYLNSNGISPGLQPPETEAGVS